MTQLKHKNSHHFRKKTKKVFFALILIIIANYSNIFAQKLEIADALHLAYQLEGHSDKYLFDKSVKYYKEILKEDSLNYKANYGLGTLYYNESVYLNNNIIDMYKEGKIDEKKRAVMYKKVEYYFDLADPYVKRYQRLSNKSQ
jgi:hypothetical protein